MSLLNATLKMCIRPDHPEDGLFMDILFREKDSQKRDVPTPSSETTSEKVSAIADINSKLDDFLAMYDLEEDDIETQKENEEAIVDMSQSFTCAFCHGTHCEDLNDTPVFLCHHDTSRTTCLIWFD